jgi:hypothetical protein
LDRSTGGQEIGRVPKNGEISAPLIASVGIKIAAGDSCFVIMPFGGSIGATFNLFTSLQSRGQVCTRFELTRTFSERKIIDQIWSGINAAKVLVAELSDLLRRKWPFWDQKLIEKVSENILSALKNPEGDV